jgi:hypothetical protein
MNSRWPRNSRVLLFATVLSTLASACGVKSAPMAPELVRPERIVDLRAAPDPQGIKLTWGRPTHYAGGHMMRDLDSFVILRGNADGPLTPVAALAVTDRERFSVEHDFMFVDEQTSLDKEYRYEIVSRTVDGYVSEPSNQVEITRIKPSPPPNPENFHLPASPASPGISN